MQKLVRNQSKKRGLPPGTPVFIGEKQAEAVRITVIDYDEAEIFEKQLESIDECLPFKDKPTITWINVDAMLAQSVPWGRLMQETRLNESSNYRSSSG